MPESLHPSSISSISPSFALFRADSSRSNICNFARDIPRVGNFHRNVSSSVRQRCDARVAQTGVNAAYVRT